MNLRELFIIKMTKDYLTGNKFDKKQLYESEFFVVWDYNNEYFGLCNMQGEMYVDKKYCKIESTLIIK